MEGAAGAQLRLGDPDLAGFGTNLLEALRPASRQGLLDVVEMAVLEVSGQLAGRRVEIRLVEPELVVVADESRTPPPTSETVDSETRMTLRLPGCLNRNHPPAHPRAQPRSPREQESTAIRLVSGDLRVEWVG